jgi:hypothetical protein
MYRHMPVKKKDKIKKKTITLGKYFMPTEKLEK